MAQNLQFTGDTSFLHEVDDIRQEQLEMFLMEGGNNGEPVLNPDGVTIEEFEDWRNINAEWLV
mgnify:FL=1